MISGKKLKKSDAYASLGEYVTKHHNIPWSPEQAKGKDKYDLYFYREIWKLFEIIQGNKERIS